MTTVLILALALLGAALVNVGFYLGRRSNVERAINRRLARETRLPGLDDQTRADRAEFTQLALFELPEEKP